MRILPKVIKTRVMYVVQRHFVCFDNLPIEHYEREGIVYLSKNDGFKKPIRVRKQTVSTSDKWWEGQCNSADFERLHVGHSWYAKFGDYE